MPDPDTPTTDQSVLVEDNDSSTTTTTRTEDNLDGDVTVTINANSQVCCDPCAVVSVPCSDRGYEDYIYPVADGGHASHHRHGHGPSAPISVTVRKTNTTFNFGGAFIPAGHYNTQGGQGASVTGSQQTLPTQPAPCCHTHYCDDTTPGGGNGDDEPVITNRIINETYNTTNNTANNIANNEANNGEPATIPVTNTEGDQITSENL